MNRERHGRRGRHRGAVTSQRPTKQAGEEASLWHRSSPAHGPDSTTAPLRKVSAHLHGPSKTSEAASGQHRAPPQPAAAGSSLRPVGLRRGPGGASGRAVRAPRPRGAERGPPGATDGDWLWLNRSASPRPAGNTCAAAGEHGTPFSADTAALLAALMGLLGLATVLGNALVILAFVVDRSLRTQGHFFFLNLAIADLLVGECWCAGKGRGLRSLALNVLSPSSVRRQLLHPPLHPLRADRQVEAQQGLV